MELLGTAEHDEVELRTLGVSSYFMEIGSFRRRTNDVPFRIDEVVKVRGDKRPGQQPFPHPFPARMPIEVATAAVEGLSMPGDLVLDPMSGSGVVSKAAIALGRRAVAFDIDPLAVVQGRALCSPTAPCAFVETAARVRDRAAEILSHELTLGREWDGFDDEGRRFLEYWFPRAPLTSSSL